MKRDVFQAISDPTRRAILMMIAAQAMTPNAIAEEFETSRQAVSKHIKVLFESELLKQEKTGREIIYHFNPDKIKDLDMWLGKVKKTWEDRFSQLDTLLSNLNSGKK